MHMRTSLLTNQCYYTGFPRSCNNALLRKVISTCAVKKWPLSMRLQDLLLQEIEVLLFQVLASS